MRIAAMLLAAVLALGPSTASATPPRLATACKKSKSPGKAKPPKQDKCREKCERKNRIAHCADDEGHMMPCPCRCP
jgi:hypothetical protein